MKNIKTFSLVIVMLISFLSLGQEKKTEIHFGKRITKENRPLWIVDDFVTTDNTIKKMKTENIASVKVVKGDSAILVYGSRGKNGVIIVKTKELSKREIKKLKKQSKLDLKEEQNEK
jgi:Ca-activated chloride channel family protein